MTETRADDKTAERFARKRGVGFPVVPLDEAVNVIKKAGRQGNEHPISAFAHYLGHGTTNSGSFKRNLAAFRDWRLITRNGEKVALTNLGQRIAYPTNSDEELKNLQEAFRNCGIFLKVYEDTAKGEPYAFPTIANLAIRYGVSPVSKDRFVRSFTESAVTAGFAELDGGKITFIRPTDGTTKQEPPQDPRDEESDEEQPKHAGESPPPPQDKQDPPADTPVMTYQLAPPIQAGTLTFEIRSYRSLSQNALTQMLKVINEVEKLAELLNRDQDHSEGSE